MAESKRGLVVVRSPFFVGGRMVGVGEVWSEDDSVVKGYPNAFRPLEVKSSSVVAARRVVTAKPKRQARKKT